MIGQLAAYFRVQWLVLVRTAGPGKLIGLILVLVLSALGVLGGLAASVGAFFLAGLIASAAAPTGPALFLSLGLAIAGYFFMALFGVVTDMQRRDPFDISKLLHLPVPTFAIFLFNLLASMFTVGNLVFVPALAGFTAGLVSYLGPRMALGVAHGLLFLVAFSAFLYLCRGTLERVLRNRRRRNIFLSFATFGIIILFQVPGFMVVFFGDVLDGFASESPEGLWDAYAAVEPYVDLAHLWLPPLWISLGFRALAEGNFVMATASLVGLAALAGIMLRAAYRQTLRALRAGGERGVTTGGEAFVRRPFTGRAVPLLGNDTASLALATMLGLVRTQTGMVMLVSPFFVVMIFWAMFNLSPEGLGRGTSVVFAIALPYFGALSLLLNQFGMDREAFRTLLLLPTDRSRVLLAKNAGFAPYVVLPSLLLVSLFSWWGELGAAAWLQYGLVSLTVFFAVATVGNFMSTAVPTRVSAERFGRAGGSQLVMMFTNIIGMVVIMVTIAFSVLAAEMAGRWFGESPETAAQGKLLFQGGLLVLAAVFWRIALVWAGDALQENEQSVLATLEKGKD